MKRLYYFAAVAGLAGLFIWSSVPRLGIDVSSSEYEAGLRSNLVAHEIQFEQLIGMIREDKIEKIYVPENGAWIPYVPISQGRLKDYQRLCETLGIRRGVHHDQMANPKTIILVAEDGGFAGHSWEVGYAWSAKPPKSIEKGYPGPTIRYKSVRGNWYLYNYDQG
jgi:hypothetical protein